MGSTTANDTTAGADDGNFEKLLSSAAAFSQRLANRPRFVWKGCLVTPRNTPQPKPSEQKKTSMNLTKEQPPPPSLFQPTITCTKCGRPFDSHSALLLHQMTTEHNYCRACYSFFPDTESLLEHRDQVHNFSCVKCASVFVSATSLMGHQRRSRHAYCGYCDGYFTKKDSFEVHMAVHGADCTSPNSDASADEDKGTEYT